MPPHVSSELRRLVADRAGRRCEYCLLTEGTAFHRHEPDHIIPHQHGSETHPDNLALACLRCNRLKGPNVGSFDPLTGQLVPFFNPREQDWRDHFSYAEGMIIPLSAEGRVTAKLLRFNDDERIAERRLLADLGSYRAPSGQI